MIVGSIDDRDCSERETVSKTENFYSREFGTNDGQLPDRDLTVINMRLWERFEGTVRHLYRLGLGCSPLKGAKGG